MKGRRKAFTLKGAMKDAQKYNTKTDWRKNSPAAYNSARRNKWITECCKHMASSKPKRRWTLEKCKKEALKYSSKQEWRLKGKSAYSVAQKRSWLDECCAHMNSKPIAKSEPKSKGQAQLKAWKTMKRNEQKREQVKTILENSKRKAIELHETPDSYIAIIKK